MDTLPQLVSRYVIRSKQNMINFLPPEAKIAVKHEYRMRAISIWMLSLATATTVGVLLLLPTYVWLKGEREALATEVIQSNSATGTEAYVTARTALMKAQTLAVQLKLVSPGPTASEVLREIQKGQTSAITTSGFSYEYNGTSTPQVAIHGIAETREALAAFSAALERNPMFVRAEVPVSDLAKDRDLPFTLTLTLAKHTP